MDLPIALAPIAGSPDEHGCFSGCAVNNGLPTIIYTSASGANHDIQTQSLATSGDDLLTWDKYPGNPVLANIPPELGQTRDFRDPFVWKEADGWYMVLGSRIKDVGGVVLLYRSQNLIDWEYLNPHLIDDHPLEVATWECPNFFKLGDDWVLIVSTDTKTRVGHVFYFIGGYENQRFTPTSTGVLDHGVLYAPLTFVDDQSRRILIGWLRESRPDAAQLLDGSVLEIIANHRTSLTCRIYRQAASDGLKLLGSKAHLQSLDLWEMPSIW